ncbi:MAG: hypothetical protein CL767_08370 [Chloroflexi bacterium]|nr:hypothetical protein [Chloroflexota bacterium]
MDIFTSLDGVIEVFTVAPRTLAAAERTATSAVPVVAENRGAEAFRSNIHGIAGDRLGLDVDTFNMGGLAGLDAVVELFAVVSGAITAAKGTTTLAVPVKTEQHSAEPDALDVHSFAGALNRAGVRTAGVLTAQNELCGAAFGEGSGNRLTAKKEKVQKINAIGEIYCPPAGRVRIDIRRLGAGQWSAPEKEVVENVHRVGEIDFKIQVGISPQKRGSVLCSCPRCNQNDCQED